MKLLCLNSLERYLMFHCLLIVKKFRSRGGRDGALTAMRQLEADDLGKLVLKKSKGSIKVLLYY